MPFIYEFKLNKEKLSGVEVGFTTNRKWEEALDDAKVVFPFMTTATPLSMFGLFDIEVTEINNHTQRQTIGTKKFEYLIYSDRVLETTKYGTYKHEIHGLEYTAKLDAYIMSSLAKSRSVYKDTQAPFITNEEINTKGVAINSYILSGWVEPFKVQDTYYSNTSITFPEVKEAYVKTTNSPYYTRRADAVIYTNAPLVSGTSPHILSNGSATWVFPKGKWRIDYGFTGSATDDTLATTKTGFQWIYRFYINVIDSSELSLYDIINEVRHCISTFGGIEDTVYYNSTRVFEIDPSQIDYLKSIQAPQMFLDSATARQMLIFAMSYINSLPRLEWNSDRDILKIEKYSESQGTFSMKDVGDYASEQDTSQIGQRSYSKISQALPNNLNAPTIYNPSQSGFVQVRSSITELTANNFEIKLQEGKPIYTPKDLLVYAGEIQVVAGTLYDTVTFDDVEISLMPRWINKDEWLLKLVTLNYPDVVSLELWDSNLGRRPNRVGNLSWQMGDTSVKLSDIYGDLFQSNLIINVYNESVREWFLLNIPEPYVDPITGIMEQNYQLYYDIPADVDYKDWRFRVEYITDETIVTKQDKKDLSQIDFYSEMRLNQDESMVNMVRQSRKANATLQRTGNVENSFSKIHQSLSDAYLIGTRDVNRYTITEITTQWYNDYYINTYYLTRYHNRIQQATYVDQTYRWRDNYAKTVFKRQEHYGDYLMVVPPDETEVTETLTKIYTNATVKRIVDILLNSTGEQKTKASIAVVRTDGMLEEYPDEDNTKRMIVVPLSSYGLQDGFSFTFGFDNNQVAGVQLGLQGSKYYNNAVRYTDSNGRFTRFGFWILRDLVIDETDMESYPLLSVFNYGDLYSSEFQYFGCGFMNSDDGAGEPMLVNKDPLTNYVQTYELKMLSYYVNLYVFGIKFFTDNFIVDNPTSDKKAFLYLYKYNNATYDMLEDLRIKPYYSSVIELDSDNSSFDIDLLQYRFIDIDFEDVTSWAIGNANGDLYVACNEAINGFDIIKSHFRPLSKAIGRIGYFNKIYEFEGILSMAMNFNYAVQQGVAYNLNSEIPMALDFNYAVQEGVAYDLNSTIAMSLDFAYRKTKDIGFNLNSNIAMSLQFNYAIGDSSFYELNSTLALALDFEYRKSKDIGFDLNSNLTMALAFDYTIQLSLYYDLNSTIPMSMVFEYRKSKDIGFSLNSSLPLALNIAYTRAYRATYAPTLSDKSIEDVKQWGSSTSAYWAKQDEGNRGTWYGDTLPDVNEYLVGFAMRMTDGTLPLTYTYFVVIKIGDKVSWKVTNNETTVSVAVYCAVGTGSYQSYGTIGASATSGTLTRTVTDSNTTVYCYVKATDLQNSDVVSL